MVSTSSICSPTRITGLSAVIGSWKIIAMRSPAQAAEVRGRLLQQIVAFQQDAAGRRRELSLRQQAHDGVRRHRFAGAGFADDADDLAGGHRERDVLDRVLAVRVTRQPHGETLKVEDGRGH